jgi:hypothetical protein
MEGVEAAARKARENVFGDGARLQSDESVPEKLEQPPNEGSHVEENGEGIRPSKLLTPGSRPPLTQLCNSRQRPEDHQRRYRNGRNSHEV